MLLSTKNWYYGSHCSHSFYRLQRADLLWKLVVERAASQNLVREHIMEVHCIIWDEASMSSQRILKLATFLHHVLAKEGESLKPFRGKQLIVVAEFLQPPPVSNLFDEGRYMFKSSLWRNILPHRYKLICIIRQDKSE